jgi:hypothetical protein
MFTGGPGAPASTNTRLWCSSELRNGWVSFTEALGTCQRSGLRQGGGGLLGPWWSSYGEVGGRWSVGWHGLSLASSGGVSEAARGMFTGSVAWLL